MKTTMFLILSVSALAETRQETKLIDAYIKAERAIEHAQSKAQGKFTKLDSYCKSKDMRMGVKPGGLVGCVPQQPPAPPAAPAPAPAPKPEEKKP